MMTSERLSRHFRLAELCVTGTGLPNAPTAEHLAHMRRFLAPGLEQVRHLLGDEPITITSGYRNPAVNRKVGGVSNSAHALGFAADGRHATLTTLEACRRIAAGMKSGDIRLDQLIYEASRGIFHLSFDPRHRMEVMTQAGGPGTPFAWGIVP